MRGRQARHDGGNRKETVIMTLDELMLWDESDDHETMPDVTGADISALLSEGK